MWHFTGRRRPVFAMEPGAGQESVWDYPRPPVCVPDLREIIISYEDQDLMIARTTHAIRVLETASPPTFYLPRSDVNLQLLVQTVGSTHCEWKGSASYWSFKSGNALIRNVGWSYDQPAGPFQAIQGYLAFYPAKLICTVDGERVRPQAGDFYGGWITDEIVGPFKGRSQSSRW